MKKVFFMIVLTIAALALYAADGTFTIPTVDHLTATALNVAAANWTPTATVGEWRNAGNITSSIVYGTTRTTGARAKVMVKANIQNGLGINVWYSNTPVITNQQTPNSGGTAFADCTTEDDALILSTSDQPMITGIFGGTYTLTDKINYRVTFDSRLPQGSTVTLTYTIAAE